MEIVKATERYLPEIMRLWQAFMKYHEDIDPRFPMRDDAAERQEQYLRNTLNDEDTLLLIAVEEIRVIAYALAEINRYPPLFVRESCGYIADMFVEAEYRRKGTGKKLLESVYAWFDDRKLKRVELNVDSLNESGYAFWRKNGFNDYIHRLYLER